MSSMLAMSIRTRDITAKLDAVFFPVPKVSSRIPAQTLRRTVRFPVPKVCFFAYSLS